MRRAERGCSWFDQIPDEESTFYFNVHINGERSQIEISVSELKDVIEALRYAENAEN